MTNVDTSGLKLLDYLPFPVYASRGSEKKAEAVAARATRAVGWLTGILGGGPDPVLFVVGPADWPQVASIPLYGMPHAYGDKVVVGTDPAPFWQQIVDWFMPHLRTETKERVRRVYGSPPDLASVFPDLVLVHELTHLYHEFDEATEQTDFPRLWLAELFANLGFYGYVAEVEPDQLPILETICSAAQEVPPDSTPVRALNDMGRSFEFENGPALYCWFEFMLIVGAKRIWEAAGSDGFRAFHDTLRDPDLDEEGIMVRLTNVHAEAARLMRAWPA